MDTSTTTRSSHLPRSLLSRKAAEFHRSWTWSKVKTVGRQGNGEPINPPPRSGAASVVVSGKLYVFGGYGGGTGRLDDFWSFDFASGLWEEVAVESDIKPGCRENNGVVISDERNLLIYLFGGYNGDSWLNDFWKFDIQTKRWTCIQESSGPIRPDEANAAVGEDQRNEMAVNHGPTRRFGYVSVVHDSKFFLFGGFDGSRWLNDMYEFDLPTARWSEIQAKGSLPSARSCPAWAKDNRFIYIQGGYDGIERKSDLYALDLDTYTWTELPCLGTPPSPRYFHSCCLYGGKIVIYGGYSGSDRLADMYTYDFDTNHWSVIDCTRGQVPSGRSSLVAQVHQNSLYVFGGYNGTRVLNDFYRFKLQPIGVAPTALVSDFQRLVNNPELADVQFLVEGKIVYGHKAVLCIRSDYFRVMLCGGMREGAANIPMSDDECSKPIDLPDVSYWVFLKVLEYIYTDQIMETSLEVNIHLMIASEQFMLDRLKTLCEDMICCDISTDTVISILAASHRHHATGLKEIALDFILGHLDDPAIMGGLTDLKQEPDLLLEIIRRNQIAGGASSSVVPGADGANQPMPDNVPQPFGPNIQWNAPR